MITIKSDREIELMREAGYMVSKTHKYLKPFIKEGITTKELDRLAEEYIRRTPIKINTDFRKKIEATLNWTPIQY